MKRAIILSTAQMRDGESPDTSLSSRGNIGGTRLRGEGDERSEITATCARLDLRAVGNATAGNYRLAMAAGQDAGNRNAKRNGRTAWNEDELNLAAKTTNGILKI